MIQNKFFEEIHGTFGFGLMRLPMAGSEVDTEKFKAMADRFIEAGFNYFDTAHGYLYGASERAVKTCISSRYSREKFLLTDKLTEPYFSCEADIRPFFQSQLDACGVEYFDFYLMHAQNHNNYRHFRQCHAYETAFALKKEGKIHHVGLSFHDKHDVLDRILTDYPEIDVVQIQFNYADYLNPAVESKACYDVCVRHNKPVIVMEPVKGGSLVNLPEDAQACLNRLPDRRSNASYAIRFAAGFPQMAMVLSGMGDMAMVEDNLSSMADFKPLDAQEKAAVLAAGDCFHKHGFIPCTVCHYCVEQNHCPVNIAIPDCFDVYNARKVFSDPHAQQGYDTWVTGNGHNPASACVHCGGCENVCPQHLEIRRLLEEVAKEFGH